MALIENLEQDNWQDFLRDCFTHTLYILKNEPHAHVGSSVADLRSWLRSGGVPKVKQRLSEQMELRRFSKEQTEAINQFLAQLIREHRSILMSLIPNNAIPDKLPKAIEKEGITKVNLSALLEQLSNGERPFEEWMYAHGHTKQDIQKIYAVIDRWLVNHNILPNRLN